MTLEEWKANEATKVRPVVSMDCRYNDHSSCEGSESALWPDGTSSVRRCICPCHLTSGQASMLAGMRDMEPTIEISDTDLIGSFTEEERAEFDSLGLHCRDSDCIVNPSTLLCDVCGVSHSEGCDLCGGRGFHNFPCEG